MAPPLKQTKICRYDVGQEYAVQGIVWNFFSMFVPRLLFIQWLPKQLKNLWYDLKCCKTCENWYFFMISFNWKYYLL